MKLIIILICSCLLILSGCNNNKNIVKNDNQELINQDTKKINEEQKQDINSPYITKKLQTYSGEIEISEEKKEFGIYEVENMDGENCEFLEVHNFSDDKFKEFEKYKDLECFKLSIYSSDGKKGIEKTFNFLKNNFFKEKGKDYNFILEDYRFSFSDKELKILSQMNISKFTIMGGAGPYLNLPNPLDKEIIEFKNDVKKYDNGIKYILNNSKTLKKIIVLDYKIFTKKDGKIEVENNGWTEYVFMKIK